MKLPKPLCSVVWFLFEETPFGYMLLVIVPMAAILMPIGWYSCGVKARIYTEQTGIEVTQFEVFWGGLPDVPIIQSRPSED